MRRILFILALLSLPALGQVPVNTCNHAFATGTSISCVIATVSQHHMLALWFRSNSSATVTYSDTTGNTGTATANCATYGIFVPCAGPFAIYYQGYCSGLQSLGMFALSSGTSSGSITFTISYSSSTTMGMFVAEYGQDLLSYEQANQGGAPTFNVVTSGSNDLITVQGGDCFSANWASAASGFTMEYIDPTQAYAVSDRINVTPGTYNVAMTESSGTAPTQIAAVFSVGTAASSTVRHARTQY